MSDYHVFGNCLRSELEFPELPQARNDEMPAWTLAVAPTEYASSELKLLGEDKVNDEVIVRLYQLGKGFRLRYDDTGCFDINADGTRIYWSPGPDANLEKVRADVLGRVLATAMHCAGLLCLHGSAVALAVGAIAFLAPKFHGKSTLATAAVIAGARLVTDDSLPVDLGPPAAALPGVHNLRLWEDSVQHLRQEHTLTESADQKHVMKDWSPNSLVSEPLAFSAIYILSPAQAQSGANPVSRERLPVLQAALSLVGQGKIGALLGKSEATKQLDRATALAQQVPVYILRVIRDFGQLDAVIHQLFEWHGGPGECIDDHRIALPFQ